MKSVEGYAIDLVCDGAESCAEDDLNEDGEIEDDVDHAAAVDLAIRANPQTVLALVGR